MEATLDTTPAAIAVRREGDNRFCSRFSIAAGDDPAGTGACFDTYLAIEVPLPWKSAVMESPRFPSELAEAVDTYQAAAEPGRARFVILAPEAADHHPGLVRVIFWRRPDGPFAAFRKREYLLPEREVVPFVDALPGNPDAPDRFAGHEQDTAHVRDILVCTHGAKDACCATFGYPMYRALRDGWAGDDLRVWRVSHIGGHRFAPTLIDLPEGRTWGHLDERLAGQIVSRTGSTEEIARCCRGWGGVRAPFEQVAEREIFSRESWPWASYHKRGETLQVAVDDTWAEVRIAFRSEDGIISGAYEARVEVAGMVPTGGCGGDGGEARQYRVTRLARVCPADPAAEVEG